MKDYYLNGILYFYSKQQRMWAYEDSEGNYHYNYTKEDTIKEIEFITQEVNAQPIKS